VTDPVRCAAIDRTGSWLIWGSANGNLRLHGLINNEKNSIDAHQKGISTIAINPRNSYIAAASEDGAIKIFSPYPLRLLKTLEGHGKTVNSLAFSPDGNSIVSGSSDTTVRLWDLAGKQKLKIEPRAGQDTGSVFSVLFHPRGAGFAAGFSNGLINVYNFQGKITGQYAQGHDNHVNGLAFSPDGSLLASGCSDKLLIIWNANHRQEATFKMQFNEVLAVAWHPRDELIATGGFDNAIRLWNRKGQVRVLTGHQSYINSLNFTANGRFLISTSADSTIKIWNLATGACMTVVNLFNNEDYLDYDSEGHFDCNDYARGFFVVYKGDKAYRPEEVMNELYRPAMLPKFLRGEAY
jgi:WD40 repeat protein